MTHGRKFVKIDTKSREGVLIYSAMVFKPNLTILPPQQLRLWQKLDLTPDYFTLYGGTAIALRLGHRASIDFDFFSNQPFDPYELASGIPYLNGAESVRVASNTLTCRVDYGGPVLVSFFGGLGLGQAAPRDQVLDRSIYVASLLDLAGAKVAVVQKRAEAKDYLDIDALLQNGIDLPNALAAGRVIYGLNFNPLISLKALSFFDDVPLLPTEVQKRLSSAVKDVDPSNLPALTPFVKRKDKKENRP